MKVSFLGPVKFSSNAKVDLSVPPTTFFVNLSTLTLDPHLVSYSLSGYDLLPNTTYDFYYLQEGAPEPEIYIYSFITNTSDNLSVSGTFAPIAENNSYAFVIVPSISAVNTNKTSPSRPQIIPFGTNNNVTLNGPTFDGQQGGGGGGGGGGAIQPTLYVHQQSLVREYTCVGVDRYEDEGVYDLYGNLIDIVPGYALASYVHTGCHFFVAIRGEGFPPLCTYISRANGIDSDGFPAGEGNENFLIQRTGVAHSGFLGNTKDRGRGTTSGKIAFSMKYSLEPGQNTNGVEGFEFLAQTYLPNGELDDAQIVSLQVQLGLGCPLQEPFSMEIGLTESAPYKMYV